MGANLRWRYFRPAIDSAGATINFLLSALREAVAFNRPFRNALSDRSYAPMPADATDPSSI